MCVTVAKAYVCMPCVSLVPAEAQTLDPEETELQMELSHLVTAEESNLDPSEEQSVHLPDEPTLHSWGDPP